MLGFGAVTFALLIAQGIILFTLINTNLTAKINKELDNTLETTTQMVNGIIMNSMRGYLRGIAEKNRDLIQSYYNKVEAGAMTKDTAMSEIKKLFKDPVYGKIGTTGYLAGVDSGGVLIIHPKSEGANVGSYDFMKQAIALKNGYIEYMWKKYGGNRRTGKSRLCFVFRAMGYYRMGIVVQVRIRLDDQRARPEGLHTLDKNRNDGYPFVLDRSGTLIIHPKLEGQNLMEKKDARGNLFIKQILERKTAG